LSGNFEGLEASPDKQGFTKALQELAAKVALQLQGRPLTAVAHRVVHGGATYREAVLVTASVFKRLEALSGLAPLHQPHNLEGISRFQALYPQVPQVACFDTAFHAHLPPEEYLFALPASYSQQGIRRYGFHGLSYAYLQTQLQQRSARANQRVVMAHLGNGASLCAMQQGESIATTMGFSALEGLMMGTRSGAIDPGVLLHLLGQGMSPEALTKLLYKQSGLLGVSGVAADMRTLRESTDPQAQLAIDMFTHRIVREAGAMTACLQGLDVLAFTGGIGEHDAVLRQQVCAQLQYLGVSLDEQKNLQARGQEALRIDQGTGSVEVWVIPTDEGRMAALSALDVVLAATHQSS
jgi:acetate kinase